MFGRRRSSHLSTLALVVVFIVACANRVGPEVDDSTADPAETELADGGGATGDADERTEDVVDDGEEGSAALPERPGPREETTGSVPHIQTSAVLVPEVDAELERRVYSLPGVEMRESTVSLPGARSLWLGDDVELLRPEILAAGREFGHIHPDGSLHLWLPVERAEEVDAAKWGELHPWVTRDGFWNGVVMVYTPEDLDELEITVQLVVDAYNFTTGADLDPDDVA
ncbi:MAG: luciferase family protein [Actinomycetota bacterium]